MTLCHHSLHLLAQSQPVRTETVASDIAGRSRSCTADKRLSVLAAVAHGLREPGHSSNSYPPLPDMKRSRAARSASTAALVFQSPSGSRPRVCREYRRLRETVRTRSKNEQELARETERARISVHGGGDLKRHRCDALPCQICLVASGSIVNRSARLPDKLGASGWHSLAH